MADPWATGALEEALPEPATAPSGKNHDPSTDTTTTNEVSEPKWTEPEKVDYTALASENYTQGWGSDARTYEWKDEYGDVGPKYPELELELFGEPSTRRDRTGLDFSKIESIEVQQEGPVKIDPVGSFRDAGLHPAMLENVELCGYDNPTPIQKFTIPSILQGHDVIGIAQTGSGKTAAYLIPILSKLMGKAKKLAAPRPNPITFREGIDEVTAEPLVLIVVPTRELAVQIFNEARKFCYRTMLRPCVVYGGVPTRQQISLLTKGCDVLIGTPGRLTDFIQRPNVLTLRRLKHMILDEADEMLDNDWSTELEMILNGGEQDVGNVNFGLFSATFPKGARDLAKEYLTASHVRFRVGRAGSTTENIKQVVLEAERHEKRELLIRLLGEMSGMRTIIFVNSRQEADNLDDFLFNMELPVTSIHSDRTQQEREAAMRGFRSGNAPILVATGVTARGIDVRNVMHVINYDLPSMDHGGIEEYTHRIGRTGRIGHRGVATSFYSERDEPLASVLTRTLLETGQEIPDFLESYVPEGEARDNLKFEADSDFEPQDVGGAGGGEDGCGQPDTAEDTGACDNDAGSGGGDGWGGGSGANTGESGGDDGWGGGGTTSAAADSW
ncbi:P-loop containing nucleoside triphosphate hydrolase protein [Dactylonectria estremocensis]|uniref:RNA helicase n=1 Tax=Dactylonectria estremocensis TaxID=1079267 RepID=A0A9P9FBQ9_9HYPO|nr:P-loop containing nucleoside triphosphate hydrolase protein [Dactylonectria estremocensis]